ncbi:hypothetical protein LC087_10290 [Bacillus carboniphilus]|uniref:Phage protein n=1 Tax=Bacillus carboniphilus TaxID=86663 RepID=A0ABY9JUH5_9BACI|nr:hypothetical protein [Bacillus carboniphilus]WLR41315.1 hypothetical protein LC087_10290 [Bacillus carboniphilus]
MNYGTCYYCGRTFQSFELSSLPNTDSQSSQKEYCPECYSEVVERLKEESEKDTDRTS